MFVAVILLGACGRREPFAIEQLGKQDLLVGTEAWFAVITDRRESLPSLFDRLQGSSTRSADDRDATQLAIKQVIRRDYLSLHPEIQYVAWQEHDATASLQSWWSAHRREYEQAVYPLPPGLQAIPRTTQAAGPAEASGR
jgi:hypothetical protein